MSCFCKTSLLPLSEALPILDVPAAASARSLSSAARAALALDEAITDAEAADRFDRNWPSSPMPRLNIPPQAITTIAALAQLRAQALARLGVDLLVPAQLTAFARIAATLDARLAAIAEPAINLEPWLQLASLNNALARIMQAIQSGTLTRMNIPARANRLATASQAPRQPPPQLQLQHHPGAQAFVEQLAPLAAIVTAMSHLNISPTDMPRAMEALAAAVRALSTIALPRLPTANLTTMCQLSAGLAAVAQLGASLGVNPVQVGFREIRAMVAAALTAVIAALARLGVTLADDLINALDDQQLPATAQPAGAHHRPVAGTPAVNTVRQPALPSFVNPAMVAAARQLDPVAFAAMELNLNFNATQTLAVGLSASAFAAHLSATLGIVASPRPCGVCDSRAIMSGLSASAAA